MIKIYRTVFVFVLLCSIMTLVGCNQTFTQKRNDIPVQNGVMHRVAAGETIDAIAHAYQISPQLLKRQNSIRKGTELKPGLRLFIPGANAIQIVNTEAEATVIVNNPDGLWHEVLAGETLIAIAGAYREYNVTMRELQQVNSIQDPSTIRINQRLWIPRALEYKEVEHTPIIIVSADPLPIDKEPAVEVKVAPDPKKLTETKPTPAPTSDEPTKQESDKVVTSPLTEKPVEIMTPIVVPAMVDEPAEGENEFPRKVKKIGTVNFQWPLKGTFRVLRTFHTATWDNHNPGIDLGAADGTSIYAAADGTVKLEGGINDAMGNVYGNYIIIGHNSRSKRALSTTYAHNAQNLVRVGQKVKRGQEIAKMGHSGQPSVSSDGILHFVIRDLAKPLDPKKVLPPLEN